MDGWRWCEKEIQYYNQRQYYNSRIADEDEMTTRVLSTEYTQFKGATIYLCIQVLVGTTNKYSHHITLHRLQ